MASAIWRARSAASRRRRSASRRAAAMRSRLPILRESRAEARSSARPFLPFRSARSDLELRPLRASAARSRFEERDSLREEAVSRPPRFDLAGDLAAAFAAAFLAGFLAAACADAAAKRMMTDRASATRGNLNFGVIEPFLA